MFLVKCTYTLPKNELCPINTNGNKTTFNIKNTHDPNLSESNLCFVRITRIVV